MHNKELAKRQGLNEKETGAIDALHEALDSFLMRPTFYANEEQIEEILHGFDYCLQWLWKFPLDKKYHKYARQYKFKKEWAGRKFQCKITKEIFVIPEDVYEGAFYAVGECFVDVGRLGCYSRFGGDIVEIIE